MAGNGIKIIDAHTHVQFEQYDKDRDDVVARSLAEGVGMINAGADLKSSKDAVDLAHKYENGVWAAVGIHPTEPKDFDKLEEVEKLATDPKVVGIGECGLDYAHFVREQSGWKQNGAPAIAAGNGGFVDVKKEKDLQKEIFEKHIEFSRKYKKPLVIHCREAFADTIDALTVNKNNLLPEPGILHFFTGTIDDAKRLLDLNFSFTFGGLITFNRSFDDVLKFIPLEKILVETDAPFVTPVPNRGKRNEPAFIVSTAKELAKIKSISFEDASETVFKNTIRVFNLSI